MSRKTLSLTLALVLILGLFCIPARAAGGKWGLEDIVFKDSRGNEVTIPGGAKSCAIKVVSFTPGNPWTSVANAMDPKEILGAPDYISVDDGNFITLGNYGEIVLEFGVYLYDGPGNDIYVFEIGPDVEATKVEVSNDLKNWIHVGDAAGSISGVDMNGKVPADGKYKYVRLTDLCTVKGGTWPGADIDAVAGINVTPYNNSGWADPEIEKAFNYGLIPDEFFGLDLTKPITRREFAAVAVKLYEKLSGEQAAPISPNPFSDTGDAEVLKAFNLGITNGTSTTKFSPDNLLSREEAATMLTRTIKAAYIAGWTLATDADYTLNFTMPAKFPDDANISGWAYQSVYFMAANGIIKGMGNGNFAPRNITTAEVASGYANNSREQALAISVRSVDNLKDKPLDYSVN